MSDTDRWLTEYSNNHDRTRNPVLHWTAVPMVIVGIVALLWSLPVPEAFFNISPLLNWGITFLMAAEVYYFIISISLGIGMLPLIAVVALLIGRLHAVIEAPLWSSIVLLLLGCAALYAGKGSARGIRGLIGDLQLIMIAPVWLLSRLYRAAGIPF